MYDALEVARHIVNYENSRNNLISGSKVHKLMYMIQSFFLITDNGEPCFDSRITAMANGPVIVKLNGRISSFDPYPIWRIKTYLEYDMDDLYTSVCRKEFKDDIISEYDKKKNEQIVDSFTEYTDWDLYKLITEQTPWISAYCNGLCMDITNESLIEYFSWWIIMKKTQSGKYPDFFTDLKKCIKKRALSIQDSIELWWRWWELNPCPEKPLQKFLRI